jgi:NAD(P)H dehydrogenase (quinone)
MHTDLDNPPAEAAQHAGPVVASVVVAYQSTFGHTKAQAQAVLEGARSVAGVEAELIDVTKLDGAWEKLAAADAIIFGAPTYMGSLSSKFKGFADQMGGVWAAQQWRDKLAAGFTCSNCASGDKLQSLVQLALIAAQHGMTWVNLGLMPGEPHVTTSAANLNRLGSWLGAMAQSGANDPLLCESDAATARHLGARVASLAKQMRNTGAALDARSPAIGNS